MTPHTLKNQILKHPVILSLLNVLLLACAHPYLTLMKPIPYCIADVSQHQNTRRRVAEKEDADLES